jgi:hypothetical protein
MSIIPIDQIGKSHAIPFSFSAWNASFTTLDYLPVSLVNIAFTPSSAFDRIFTGIVTLVFTFLAAMLLLIVLLSVSFHSVLTIEE